MGYVFDFNDAIEYEKRLKDPCNRFVADVEHRLMLNLLKPLKGEHVLDIGCGTGTGLSTFHEQGLHVTGLDPSPYMLDIALKNLGDRAELYRGFAEDLPFEDNAFNYACLINTLEFVEDSRKAIEEVSRVAKDKIFLGVLNRYALKGVHRRIKGVFTPTIYNHACFFSIWELKEIIRSLLGDVPIAWRTVGQFSASPGRSVDQIEQSWLLKKYPFGAFIGMAVTLVPRFKTRPLTVPYKPKPTTEALAG